LQHVLVLNASYEPLNVCTVRRAHVLVYKGKAEVIERLDKPLRSSTGSFIWPHVIRLIHYVRVPRAIQRSKGGESIWENVVTACAPCNLRKGDRSLEQAGMELRTSPRAPTPTLFIKLAAPRIPSGWTPYLPATA
jgi:hypothetical protein